VRDNERQAKDPVALKRQTRETKLPKKFKKEEKKMKGLLKRQRYFQTGASGERESPRIAGKKKKAKIPKEGREGESSQCGCGEKKDVFH